MGLRRYWQLKIKRSFYLLLLDIHIYDFHVQVYTSMSLQKFDPHIHSTSGGGY